MNINQSINSTIDQSTDQSVDVDQSIETLSIAREHCCSQDAGLILN